VPIETRDSNLARDLVIAEALNSKITVDTQGITSSWTGNDICKFQGFYCETNPSTNELAVASIDFNSFNFGGDELTFDGFMDKLTDIAIFHANSNGFIGEVPDLSALPYLYEIDLSNNKISGSFPQTVLRIDLSFLDLRFNQIGRELPKEVFEYANLEVLFLNNNQFSGTIPHEIGSVSATYITLTGNQFTGSVPRSIGSAKNLQEILPRIISCQALCLKNRISQQPHGFRRGL
jgi:hypothetical protein